MINERVPKVAIRAPSLILALRTNALGESNEPILNHFRPVKCDLPHTTDGRDRTRAIECSIYFTGPFECARADEPGWDLSEKLRGLRCELNSQNAGIRRNREFRLFCKIGFLLHQCLKPRVVGQLRGNPAIRTSRGEPEVNAALKSSKSLSLFAFASSNSCNASAILFRFRQSRALRVLLTGNTGYTGGPQLSWTANSAFKIPRSPSCS